MSIEVTRINALDERLTDWYLRNVDSHTQMRDWIDALEKRIKALEARNAEIDALQREAIARQ
jgi:hypothetical protein